MYAFKHITVISDIEKYTDQSREKQKKEEEREEVLSLFVVYDVNVFQICVWK